MALDGRIKPGHISPASPFQRAFTLIELLVVIAIIAILVSLTLAAGTKVVSVGRERGTQWAIQALDNSMGEYIQANGAIPSPTVRDPLDTSAKPKRVPIIDGMVNDGAITSPMDSTAWYIYQLQAEGSSALAAIHQIDPRLRTAGIVKGTAVSDATTTGARTTHIVDVWGNPIRYVHPRFAGAHHGTIATDLEDVVNILGGTAVDYKFSQVFRDGKTMWSPSTDGSGKWKLSTTDEIKDRVGKSVSDGGGPPNRRPYFYSAGPDGDPSTIEDNVYTTRPNFPR